MKKSSIRAFGIACFLIGALLTVSNQLHLPLGIKTDSEKSEKQYKDELLNLEQQLKEAKDQIKLLEQNKQTEEPKVETSSESKSEDTTEQAATVEEQPKDEVVTGTLYIYSGLTPSEVAQKIKDLGIIDNSIEMELFLAQREYARSLQKGQYELNSSMSIEEIANTITGKK
jgi:hypothetical protein